MYQLPLEIVDEILGQVSLERTTPDPANTISDCIIGRHVAQPATIQQEQGRASNDIRNLRLVCRSLAELGARWLFHSQVVVVRLNKSGVHGGIEKLQSQIARYFRSIELQSADSRMLSFIKRSQSSLIINVIYSEALDPVCDESTVLAFTDLLRCSRSITHLNLSFDAVFMWNMDPSDLEIRSAVLANLFCNPRSADFPALQSMSVKETARNLMKLAQDYPLE